MPSGGLIVRKLGLAAYVALNPEEDRRTPDTEVRAREASAALGTTDVTVPCLWHRGDWPGKGLL